MKQTRKTFLKVLGASTLAVAVNPLRATHFSQIKAVGLTLGLASYTLREFNLEEVLKMTNKLNLGHIAFKSMHMPMDSTDEEIKGIVKQVNAAGIKLYGAGVVYMKSNEEVDNAFRYAKAAGLEMIIGVPNADLLGRVEQRVKETNIKLAIHNHGPEDNLYPSPKSAFDRIANMDSRMGLCIDVGHTLRSGFDPARTIKQYKDRLYDIHLKDINSSEPDGSTLEMGRGILDIPSVIKALKDINYKGVMAVEYEKDGKDPMPGLAESIGYARGIMKMV